MFGFSAKELYEYGTYLFIIWVGVTLVLRNSKLMDTTLKDIKLNTETNKMILSEMSRSMKDVSIIQAQTLDKLQNSDSRRETFWTKMIEAMDTLCHNMNGGNPTVIKIQKDLDELYKKLDNK